MGRPLLTSEEMRKRVECYFNLTEKAEIAAKARRAGLSLSSYLREIALGHKVLALPSINVAQWQALSRTTANLNQIARHLNEGRQVTIDPLLLQQAIQEVQALRLALMGVGLDLQAE